MAVLPVLEAYNLERVVQGKVLFKNISFSVQPGEILFIRGPSGVGKTVLLRSLATLDALQGGSLKCQGRSPSQLGTPKWRAQVTYVHQSRVNYKGTPADFFQLASSLSSQRDRPKGNGEALVSSLGLEPGVLQQQWAELSGGQAQRVSLAIALALEPLVLLLDEPTSACDPEATLKVEATLKASGAALVWVTHDPQQHRRVGGQQLVLPAGTLTTIPATPSAVSLVEVQDGASDRTSTAAADGSDEGSQHASVASQEVRIAVQL